MTDDAARHARAAARRNLPIRVVALADEREPDVSALEPNVRLALVWRVSLDAWASSGRPLPQYDRANMPGRMIRGRDGQS